MANLQKLLGTMLATGMAGRSTHGPGMASGLAGAMGASRGASFKNMAGLASLGYIAYKAYQERQANQANAPQAGSTPPAGGSPWGAGADESSRSSASSPSLGERLASLLSPQQAETPVPDEAALPELAMEDQKALLLIRAMIAAANADGEISAEERGKILNAMDQAGAEPDEHRVLEQELSRPRPMDELVREVQDPETAEQVYVASTVAIHGDSPAEQGYLQYWAARLKLDPERVKQLRSAA